MSVIETNSQYQLAFDAIKAKEASQTQKDAFERFMATGLPTRKHEEWKYTNLHKFWNDEWKIGSIVEPAPAQSTKLNTEPFETVVFNNGYWSEVLGAVTPEFSFVNKEADPMVDFTLAFADSGASFQLDNQEKPLYIQINRSHAADVIASRFQFHLGNSQEAKVILDFTSSDTAILTSLLTEAFVGNNSQLEIYFLQDNIEAHQLITNTFSKCGRDSRIKLHVVNRNSELVRNYSYSKMEGENSEVHLYGLYDLVKQDMVDNRTVVDHAVPNCYSNELYKGILNDSSVGTFNGKILVQLDAQKTNAFQHNPNIVLSDNAAINTKPQLEIFADDVKCSHGATIGNLDENMLFYLRQRGLGKQDARNLLLFAFAAEVLEEFSISEIKDFYIQQLEANILK